ncbi:MAG: phospholipid carrier-dependent glycosyltransferase [Acidimicrobiales bacterium]
MADVVGDSDPNTRGTEPILDEQRSPQRRWLDIALGCGLFAFTIFTRLPRLDRPRSFVFDEIYYALDGADIARRGVERGGVVHPPVGKWLIALGIRVDGMTPVGWRLAALVCGALVVVLTFAAARQVVRNRWLAAMAGLLVALDGIAYTTGRVAMLDVFVALFTMIAVWCTLAALRRWDEPRAVSRYRWATAVAVGFGIGVKWTAGYVLLVAIIGFVIVEARRADHRGQGRRIMRTVLTLGVVPIAIYGACYVPWMLNVSKTYAGMQACPKQQSCSFSLFERIKLFKDDQRRILKFHTELTSEGNSNADFAYLWIDQASPSVLFRKTCIPQLDQAPAELNDRSCSGAADGDIVEIATVANPVVWFGGLAAVLGVAWAAWRRRDAAIVVVVLFFLYQWFPWVIDPFRIKDAITTRHLGALLQERRAYSFYLAPMIAVLAIWPAIALDRRKLRWLGIPLALGALAAFVFYLPIWQGQSLSPGHLDSREWWEVFR